MRAVDISPKMSDEHKTYPKTSTSGVHRLYAMRVVDISKK
jgi:hypothetical protein